MEGKIQSMSSECFKNNECHLLYLERSPFWIAAESPDEMWIQVVRHNSP